MNGGRAAGERERVRADLTSEDEEARHRAVARLTELLGEDPLSGLLEVIGDPRGALEALGG